MTSTTPLAQSLKQEFESLQFARSQFPMLTDWGVEDFSVTIHSLGCNYLSALGRAFGLWAMSEYPVRMPESDQPISIRPDVVWWKRSNAQVALLGEFERFESKQEAKLTGKAKNLLKAYHQLEQQPEILLLMSWTLSGTDVSGLNSIRILMREGFSENGIRIAGAAVNTDFLLATAVFGVKGENHHLIRIQQ